MISHMVVLLVHWLIRRGEEDRFRTHWSENMKVGDVEGFYQETLTRVDETVDDPRFHSFALESPRYTTFINVGVWESVAHFDAAIRRYMPTATVGNDNTTTIKLESFEFKLRERIVLKVEHHRPNKPMPSC